MISAEEFASWTGGTVNDAAKGISFERVDFDSRRIKPGMMYAALKGDKTDGHRFVKSAIASGASLALVKRSWAESEEGASSLPLICVDDPLSSLQTGAEAYRRELRKGGMVAVGVTGSAGKTTTKELTRLFLSTLGKTHATEGNYNNGLGLPVSVLSTPRDAKFAVYEMGTNHPGEIAPLAAIAQSDVAIISSIGEAHIEFFKTRDGTAHEKGALFESLREDGLAVLGKWCDRLEILKSLSRAPVAVVPDDDEPFRTLAYALRVRLPGVHNAGNARLAWEVAGRFGAKMDDCLALLKDFSLPDGRWTVSERGGVMYINDAYNANPASMIASIETFKSIEDFGEAFAAGRRILVLGDMFELGQDEEALHRKVGRRARELGFDAYLLVGSKSSRWMGDEIAKGLGCDINLVTARDSVEAKMLLAKMVRPGDAVLLKASRGMALERALP